MNRENERMEYKLLGPNGKLPDSLIKELLKQPQLGDECTRKGIARQGSVTWRT